MGPPSRVDILQGHPFQEVRMFEQLIESQPASERTIAQVIVSSGFHALLIAGAIQVTRGAAEMVQDLRAAPVTDFTLPEPPPPPRQTVAPEAIISVNPLPQGFQTIVPPRDLPTSLPPVNLQERFDARDYNAKGAPGGVADGIPGLPGPGITEGVIGTASYTVDQVDEPAEVIGGPPPAYPDVLRSVGVEGVVQLQFVVGSDGRVEPRTIRVVRSSNPAFEANAVAGIAKIVFRPARVRGTPVRQLVTQNIRFVLGGVR
jgi:protein TonB